MPTDRTFMYIFCSSPSRSSPGWLPLPFFPLYLSELYSKLCLVWLISLINPFSSTSHLPLVFGNLFILQTAFFFSSVIGFTDHFYSSSFYFSEASGGRDAKILVFSPNLNRALGLLPFLEEIKCFDTAFSYCAEKNTLCFSSNFFSHSKHR